MTRMISVIVLVVWRSTEIAGGQACGRSSASASCVRKLIVTLPMLAQRTPYSARTNARLVEAHTALPLTKALGSTELASADGLRFVVPVRSVHAAANPKYFGRGKGVTYINYTSAGSIGFFGFVVPGTLRDSMVILDGLLEQQTSLQPTTLVTDSASYSDVVFGLFMLLGYRFCPRLADLGDTRFYRISQSAHYGSLNGVARHRINTDLITRH